MISATSVGGGRRVERRDRQAGAERGNLRAPGTLGSVESGVRLRVQLRAAGGEIGDRRDARRERNGLGQTPAGRGLQCLREQAADDDSRAFEVRVGKENGELVAAGPKRTICQTQGAAHELTEPVQNAVAGGVTFVVVDRLELVQVDDGKRQRHAVAHGGCDLALEVLVEGAVVAEARQRITERIGHGSLVPDLQVGMRREPRRDRGTECNGGNDARADDRGEHCDQLIAGQEEQCQSLNADKGEDRQHGTDQQPGQESDLARAAVHQVELVDLHSSLLRCAPDALPTVLSQVRGFRAP